MAPLNILVTGACGVTPRAIARSLRASPAFSAATLVGADRGGNWYGFYEGLYDRVYRVSQPGDPGYAELLADICEREAIAVALVGPEAEVRFWSGREFPVPTLLPPAGLVEIAISKGKLYDALRETGLVPRYRIVDRDDLLARSGLDLDGGPVWLRDYSEASSSGIGSLQVTEPEEAYAWAYLNPEISSFMVAEHLPGRNVACTLLFHDDELLKAGCYERLEYFMGHLAVSGITGNINRGRLLNDERARTLAEQAVRFVCGLTGERAHGLLTVDLREDRTGALKVTEINVRHVAATSALAAGRREHGRGAGAGDARPSGRDRRAGSPFSRGQRDPARHRRCSALAHRLPRACGRGTRGSCGAGAAERFVIRRSLVLLGVVGLVAGCGGGGHEATTQTVTHPKPPPTTTQQSTGRKAKLVVTILDGDLRVRVPGAHVRLSGQSGTTNRHGVTTIEAPRTRHEVSVAARGYSPIQALLDFRGSRRRTIRIYQPDLQWTLYGATTARTQAPTQIRLRPPFRVVWSRGLDRLIEFPAVVDDGIAYIGNAGSRVHAISMRSGKFAWVHTTPGSPRMASSPAVYGDEIVYHTMSGWVYVLDRSNGRLEWSWNAGSAIESSPVVVDGIDYFGDAAGEMYALDLQTHRLTLAPLPRRQDHLERGDLRRPALHRRLRRAALGTFTGVRGDPLGRPCEREDLRDARGCRRPGVRPVRRVLVLGLLHERAAPLARSDRRLRLLVACRLGRSGVLRLVQRSASTGSRPAVAASCWRVPTGGAISGAAVIVDGVAYVGSFSHQIIGVSLHTGHRLVTFPHGQYVPVSGNGMRLLFHGFSRLYAVEPRRRRAH